MYKLCGHFVGDQDSILHTMKNSTSDAQQIQAPIGFICDELGLNRKNLAEHIVMDQLEQLYLAVNGQAAFTETQVLSHCLHLPFQRMSNSMRSHLRILTFSEHKKQSLFRQLNSRFIGL